MSLTGSTFKAPISMTLLLQAICLQLANEDASLRMSPPIPKRLCPHADIGETRTAPSSRQHDQPRNLESVCEGSVLSHSLSKRGDRIVQFYKLNFEEYEAFQSDEYDQDSNASGYVNLAMSENKLCIDLVAERLNQSDMNYVEDIKEQYPNPRGHRFGFFYGIGLCAYIHLMPIYVESEITDADTRPFQLTVGKLEQALLEAKTQNKKVKGLLLSNPWKATGDVYSQESLRDYLEFAKRNDLFVVIEEMYMLSVFDDPVKIHSVLSMESFPAPQKTFVIWNISKDFGLGFGALYTPNEDVALAVLSLSSIHSISGITQYHLCRLLWDRDWIDNTYLPTIRSRLATAHAYVMKKLHELEEQHNRKIIFHNCSSGLYTWINLKNFLEPCTFEEELLLYRRFLDHKVILSRGQSYVLKEPGWFRLSFAENPDKLMLDFQNVAMEVLDSKKAICGAVLCRVRNT
ncbi:probable inactive 1-aminocyclopropane-1-carboxylate synthase-like protein 2 [Octodon degus]|uniref:Probable inactive 1-aminocyclopropane-1-carboxylate synthase-like protein 2 n=1 Tax=Octodon degus TaxID=10160 RepID=A0A6P6E2Y7_OCTDE|nr:probable inactive 1-aminocyclopropane-1-carboxylate synthase-like protein 2 [Octodon degus]